MRPMNFSFAVRLVIIASLWIVASGPEVVSGYWPPAPVKVLQKARDDSSRAAGKAWNDTRSEAGRATNNVKRGAQQTRQAINNGVQRGGGAAANFGQQIRSQANNASRNAPKVLGKINLGPAPSFNNFQTPSAQNFGNFSNPLQNNGGFGNFNPPSSNFSVRPLPTNTPTFRSNDLRPSYPGNSNFRNPASDFSPRTVIRNVLPNGGSSAVVPNTINTVRDLGGQSATVYKQSVQIGTDSMRSVGEKSHGTWQAIETNASREIRQGGGSAAAFTQDVFSDGGRVVAGGIESGGAWVHKTGHQAGALGETGIIQLGTAFRDGYNEAERGVRQVEDVVQQANSAANQLEDEYNNAKAIHDTLRHGDREDILSTFEDQTGVTIRQDVRDVVTATDLNDGVELLETASGQDLSNVKERVDQLQAIADAGRTGKLSDMAEAGGAKSNRDQIRSEKEQGWDVVVYGNEIDHDEYIKMGGAVGASVAAGNAGPFMVYAKEWAAEQYKTISEGLIKQGKAHLAEQLTEQMLVDALQGAVEGKPAKLPISGVQIDVGVATYNHSLQASADLPQVTQGGVRFGEVRAETSLPNTHQPYVRMNFTE